MAMEECERPGVAVCCPAARMPQLSGSERLAVVKGLTYTEWRVRARHRSLASLQVLENWILVAAAISSAEKRRPH